jgi:hypothetical protein
LNEEGHDTMRLLPTRILGVLDCLTGLLWGARSWLFGYACAGVAARSLPVILGASAIFCSLPTNHELSAVETIPVPVHLGLDLASGTLLAVSSWLFGFAGVIWLPRVLISLLENGASPVTRTVTGPDTPGAAQ